MSSNNHPQMFGNPSAMAIPNPTSNPTSNPNSNDSSQPINISFSRNNSIYQNPRIRRESIAHSQGMGGISWGSVTIGSWLKDEVMLHHQYNNIQSQFNQRQQSINLNPNNVHLFDSKNDISMAASPVPNSSYLADLEANYCKDYSCCGQLLPTLHDLLRHYEEMHIQPDQQTNLEAPRIKPINNGIDTVQTNEVFLNNPTTELQYQHHLQQQQQFQQQFQQQQELQQQQQQQILDQQNQHQQANNERQQLHQHQLPNNELHATLSNFNFNQSNSQNINNNANIIANNAQNQFNFNSNSNSNTHNTINNNNENNFINNNSINLQQQFHKTPNLFQSPISQISQNQQHQQLQQQNQSQNPHLQQQLQQQNQSQNPHLQQQQSHNTNRPESPQFQMDDDEEMDEDVCIDDPARHLYVIEQGEDRPFTCPVVGCEKTYKNQNGLKYHRIHGHQNQKLRENPDGTFLVINPESDAPYPDGMGFEKDKPYRCEVCGKRYKNLNGLKYHRGHSTH